MFFFYLTGKAGSSFINTLCGALLQEYGGYPELESRKKDLLTLFNLTVIPQVANSYYCPLNRQSSGNVGCWAKQTPEARSSQSKQVRFRVTGDVKDLRYDCVDGRIKNWPEFEMRRKQNEAQGFVKKRCFCNICSTQGSSPPPHPHSTKRIF